MAKNRLSDLRDHLFEALEGLKDPEKPMEIERARAICEVGQTIIASAKVEVDMLRAIDREDRRESEFFHPARPLPVASDKRIA